MWLKVILFHYFGVAESTFFQLRIDSTVMAFICFEWTRYVPSIARSLLNFHKNQSSKQIGIEKIQRDLSWAVCTFA